MRRVIVHRRDAETQRMDSENGFTLLEVMVALVVGTVMIGGVMGLISSSLQFTQRVDDKSRVVPILEAVAEQILANPEEVAQGALNVSDFVEGPPVNVTLVKAFEKDSVGLGSKKAHLHRVQLNCRGHLLEFSMMIPEQNK